MFLLTFVAIKPKDLFEMSSGSEDEGVSSVVQQLLKQQPLNIKQQQQYSQDQQHKQHPQPQKHQQPTTTKTATLKAPSKRSYKHTKATTISPPTNTSTPVGKQHKQQQQQQHTPVNRTSTSSTPVQRSIRRYGKIKKSVNPFSPARKQVRTMFFGLYIIYSSHIVYFSTDK